MLSERDLEICRNDPMAFASLLWDCKFYDKQEEIVHSVKDHDETIVVAGNRLGKDFTAAFIVLWFFLTRDPVRIVTTSVAESHLRVLWDEIGRFIQTCRMPLLATQGGSLVLNHRDIRKVFTKGTHKGERVPISYTIGQVSEKGEKMAGHHAEHTLLVVDEASSMDDIVYSMGQGWMKKALLFGNPNDCRNYFRKAVEEGDIPSEDGQRFYRKIIRICAEDSPNVRAARRCEQRGVSFDGANIIPGVINYDDYRKYRKIWDIVRQTVGLDAQFYAGAELLLYPKDWLDRANELHTRRRSLGQQIWMGIDPAEGGDKSCWALIDEFGLFKLISKQTPDTTVIPHFTRMLMQEHRIPPENVCIDRGGGGKQAADRLREMGYEIRTVAFGEPVKQEIKRLRTSASYDEKVETQEGKYVYFNKRAQLYGELSIMLDPYETGAALGLQNYSGFAIPTGGIYDELRRQLAPIPKTWDRGGEGRLKLLPKNNTEDPDDPRTLVKLIGHSPDEADSVVLAIHARLHKARAVKVGGWF